MKSCLTCRWTACSNYGKNRASCVNYIPSLEEEKKNYSHQESENENYFEEMNDYLDGTMNV